MPGITALSTAATPGFLSDGGMTPDCGMTALHPVRADLTTFLIEHPYNRDEREGRFQSAERAVPTHTNDEGDEPSFSLIRADSRRVMK